MLNRRFHETVVLEYPDGTTVDVPRAMCREADVSDQSVMDVQTRFINQARYKGDQRTLTILWPKDAPHDVMDCHVTVRGERYRVYGQPFPVWNSPTAHDMRVTVSRSLFLYDAVLHKATMRRGAWDPMEESYDEGTPTKVNLLRLSETSETEAGQSDLARIVLLELPPGTYDEGYVAFEFQGRMHRIESVDYGGEVVVIGGTAEVTDVGSG
jgi:hypothetical protein